MLALSKAIRSFRGFSAVENRVLLGLKSKQSLYTKSTRFLSSHNSLSGEYPHSFLTTSSIQDFRDAWEHLPNGARHKAKDAGDRSGAGNDALPVNTSLAGRIMSKRDMSSTLTFLDIVGGTEGKDKLQVIVDTQYLKDANGLLPSDIHRGDIIGVNGFPGKSNRGELSLVSEELVLLAPCNSPIPDVARNKITDPDLRFRKRYLDFLTNERSRTSC